MKLVVSPLAVRRLIAIADHIAADRPAAALGVEAAIRAAFALLTSHPYAGRSVRPDLRRFRVPRLPYVIFYRADERRDEVTIATIRHTAQRDL